MHIHILCMHIHNIYVPEIPLSTDNVGMGVAVNLVPVYALYVKSFRIS